MNTIDTIAQAYPVYFPFPIQAKHLTDQLQIMIIKQLIVAVMYCKLQLICLDLDTLNALLTPLLAFALQAT